MAHWINTISRDHVEAGVAGGFTQANHGRPTTLRRLARGDLIACYSPRKTYPDGDRLQAFTGIVRVTDDEPFQVQVRPDFEPWRRAIEPVQSRVTPIAPLLSQLDFIADKRKWGLVFRRGLFEIGADDFRRIAAAMGATV